MPASPTATEPSGPRKSHRPRMALKRFISVNNCLRRNVSHKLARNTEFSYIDMRLRCHCECKYRIIVTTRQGTHLVANRRHAGACAIAFDRVLETCVEIRVRGGLILCFSLYVRHSLYLSRARAVSNSEDVMSHRSRALPGHLDPTNQHRTGAAVPP